MKLALLTPLVLAAGLSVATGQASAAQVACTDNSVYTAIGGLAANNVLFLSGASAPQNFITTNVVAGLFEGTGAPGTIDLGAATGNNYCTYFDTPQSGADFRAWFGKLKATVPGLGGQLVLLIDRAKGGSVFGVNPVARAENIQTLVPSTAACTGGGTGSTATPIKCTPVGNDATLTGGLVPDWGVSDVAPYMFKDPLNVEFGATQLTPAELARFGTSITPVNELMMGYAITRRQTTANPAGAGNIVTATIIPDTYRVTKSRYASMLSGVLRSWSVQGAVIPPGGDQVVVCRRVPGSGTQSSYNWYFNNFPCTAGNITTQSGVFTPARMTDSDGFNDDGLGNPSNCYNTVTNVTQACTLAGPGAPGSAAYPYAIDATAGYTVLENSSSGVVRTCLTKAANGGRHNFQAGDPTKNYTVDFGTGGYGAIAVLSMDSLNQAQFCTLGGAGDEDVNAGFTFRHEDGFGETLNVGGTSASSGNACATAAPNYSTVYSGGTPSGAIPRKGNHICGGYEFTVELSMQYRTGAFVPLQNPKLAFVNEFIKRAKDPANNSPEWVAAIPDPLATPPVVPTNGGRVVGWTRANQCGPIIVGDFSPYVNTCPAGGYGF
jgi:hypothetical protein